MGTSHVQILPGSRTSGALQHMPTDSEKQWNVAYTRPRAEKKVHKRLKRRGIRVYLPLRETERQWSDRIKTIEVPLFSGYLFVNARDEKQAIQAEQTRGVSTLIRFGYRRAIVPQSQIDAIQRVLENQPDAQLADYLKEGDRVLITCGPLEGVEATCLEDGGRSHVRVQVDVIQQALRVVVPPHHLERIDD